MTLFYNEAIFLGWQPNLFRPNFVSIQTPDGLTMRETIEVSAQVCDQNGLALTDWFVENVVLRNDTPIHLSGSNVRNHLYFGTAPRLLNLYAARTKTHLSRILPNLSQLPL